VLVQSCKQEKNFRSNVVFPWKLNVLLSHITNLPKTNTYVQKTCFGRFK
jgi:hypothetical protein